MLYKYFTLSVPQVVGSINYCTPSELWDMHIIHIEYATSSASDRLYGYRHTVTVSSGFMLSVLLTN
jgi:hypothetical protein